MIEAEHLCMSLRGVQAAGATTSTSTFLGELADDAALRDRFRPAGSRIPAAAQTA